MEQIKYPEFFFSQGLFTVCLILLLARLSLAHYRKDPLSCRATWTTGGLVTAGVALAWWVSWELCWI